MSILIIAVLGSIFVKASIWITGILLALLVLSTILYLFAYLFCLFNDRDALRSEKYTLHKMAIEHGIYGDSRIGLIEAPREGGETRKAAIDLKAEPDE